MPLLYEVVVVVANLHTIRSTTVERLKKFTAEGDKVIVTGGVPTKVEIPVTEVDFTRWDILGTLEAYRDVSIVTNGNVANSLMYQLRRDGDDGFLFVCDMRRGDPIDTTAKLKGVYDMSVLDTLAATEWKIESEEKNGWTAFRWTFWSSSHVLIRFTPRQQAHGQLQPAYETGFNQLDTIALKSVSLSEPNVLLLDFATWKMAGDIER